MPRVEGALVAAEITPRGGKEREAALALQAMGFRVHSIGTTISVDGRRERWKAAFTARFAPVRRRGEETPQSRGVCPTRATRCVSSAGRSRAAGGERRLRRAARALLKGQSPEVIMARKAKRTRKAIIQRAGDQVSAEVVLSSESGRLDVRHRCGTHREQPGRLQAGRRTRHANRASAPGAGIQGPSHRYVLYQAWRRRGRCGRRRSTRSSQSALSRSAARIPKSVASSTGRTSRTPSSLSLEPSMG